jgi:hypothetical protein
MVINNMMQCTLNAKLEIRAKFMCTNFEWVLGEAQKFYYNSTVYLYSHSPRCLFDLFFNPQCPNVPFPHSQLCPPSFFNDKIEVIGKEPVYFPLPN